MNFLSDWIAEAKIWIIVLICLFTVAHSALLLTTQGTLSMELRVFSTATSIFPAGELLNIY